ncbi:hypothetical protein G8S49_05800 [Clostridium botulinum C]|uniref:Uncharacterized protein n=3 Tax=Clostridium botulinum TaxID=1491 RepID=A0A9P2G5C4_CLOBO|nr:hypothetical protein [Clostridium botulinum]YP_398533.1 hypothetical protein CST103 [Clostridium phage c-st]EES90283.1 conserved hypothetical protein [Clostridium phage D-1873]MCD3194853.1 hypothetical protein [Clostridium botulinum C]MCD3200212.1 hypothetical protein [Clostridium botulinum C]MCD3205721.1 hypothetical protein [Clostridium botulinum C]MCD3207444.1 hypothetical protein [Clostridium botulinum C]
MNSEELWKQRTQDDIENNKSAIKEHEIRIRKLEESNIKMELQLNEISKGQVELKNLMYETQKENRKSDELMMNKVTDALTSTFKSTIQTDNNIKLTDRKEFWGILGTIIGIGVMIAQYFFSK